MALHVRRTADVVHASAQWCTRRAWPRRRQVLSAANVLKAHDDGPHQRLQKNDLGNIPPPPSETIVAILHVITHSHKTILASFLWHGGETAGL